MNWIFAAEAAYNNGKKDAFANIKEIINTCLKDIEYDHNDFAAGTRFALHFIEDSIAEVEEGKIPSCLANNK